MEFRILGPLEVLVEGRPVRLSGQKQRVLLAALLLDANRVVSIDRLVEALWEDEPPTTAPKALQVYVSQLRKLLGSDRLLTRARGYLLRVEPAELDVDLFESLRAEGKLDEALALWRGSPLAGFEGTRFAEGDRARLEELRRACLEERIEGDLAAGRHAELIGELDGLVLREPLRQRLREQLMLALYRSGRDAEALEVFQEARRVLVEELGIEPRRQLRDLQQAILRQDPALDLRVETDVADSARAAFVGRERELEGLGDALGDAFAGRGRLVLIVGEPGIGKSRLADELIARAGGRGTRVLQGRCWEAGGAPAYWPWVQALRAYVLDTDHEALRSELGAGAAVVAQLLPELRELFPDLPEASALEAESARFRLFEAVSAFLKRVAAARPLVLVLDDLHAADEPSLLLLQFLTRELGESRLLVLGAYRDLDPTPAHPLTTALAELAREPVTRSVALAGLGEDEVARYIELTTGEAADTELIADIYEETEGNPLFVGEIVRLLATEGSLRAGAARIAIPQSVRDVIARRLRHLSEECNRTLVLASVLGREVSLAALSRLAGVSENDLLDTFDEAMTARVISDVPGTVGQLRFAHVLIRDTLYESLTTARRVRLHRQAIEVLEALYGQAPGAHLAELAHHSIAGSDFERALDYARRAGDRALDLLAFEEAARLYATALETAELTRVSDEVRCDLLLSRADAESRAGNGAASRSASLEAAEIARLLRLPHALARAAAAYGGRMVFGRVGHDDQLVPLFEEGLAALGAEDAALRSRLLARLAGALRDEHARDHRDALSREAVELAREAGSDAVLAYALAGRAHAIVAPDTLSECLALGNELEEVAARSGDREQMVTAHLLRHLVHLYVGDMGETRRDVAVAERIADELGQPVQVAVVSASRAMLALAVGRLDQAGTLNSRTLELGERVQPDLILPFYWLQRYTLCDFRGDVADVEQPLRELTDRYPTRPVFRCVLAHVHARLGRLTEARHTLDDLSQDDFSAVPFDQEWLYGMSLLAETSVLAHDERASAVIYRLLLPWKELNAVDLAEGFRGAISRYLGLLAAMLQRWDDATRQFEHALEMNERMGARPWLAHTQDDYARMLLARNHAGDPEHARDLFEAAYATYSELGMARPEQPRPARGNTQSEHETPNQAKEKPR